MIRHYIKIAFRNLSRQKVLTFINIIGLSLGLACFSLFLLFAVNEFSYNRVYKNADKIFRVTEWWMGDKDHEPKGSASMYTPVGPALKHEFPDVKDFVRFTGGSEKFVRTNDKVQRSEISFADPQVFNVFSFTFLSGEASNALKDPNRIVLTKSTALQIFGNPDAVGKIIDIKMDDAFEPFTVAAVIDDIPTNSTIQFKILGSFNYIAATNGGKESADNWHMTIGIETYVKLRDGSKLMNEPERLATFRLTHYPDEEADLKKAGLWNEGPLPVSFRLQPLRDVHINTSIEDGSESAMDPKNILILLSIAAGVLLIACINFTTLAIGRSAGRAREIGVRKVIGSGRKQLILQFLAESLLLSIFSAVLGFFLVYLLLPYFNQLADRSLRFSFQQFPEIPWLLGSLTVLVGLLAGSYPALVLSGFNPLEVLKSKIKVGGSNIFIKSLVSFQFVLSIGLIICTIIILQQLSFLRSKNLGFNKENIVAVDASGADAKKVYPLFAQSLRSNPAVIGQTASEIGLGAGEGQMGGGYEFNGERKGVIEYPVDAGFLSVMGMRLIAGRNFDVHISSDTINSVIINEALVNQMGTTPEKAIGLQLKKGKRGPGPNTPKVIVGVIRDFNFEPLNRSVRSQLFTMPATINARRFFVRIKPGDPAETLASLQATWKSIVPDLPFKYSFLDEDFDRFYKTEQRWGSIISWAGAVSIFLACLGLFGLASLAAVNRVKEVGIRKVLGASLSSIVGLLSKDFLKLVLISLVIASPIAWYFMDQWLQDFVYRIDIGYWVFAAAGALTLFIALLTVGFQAVKAGLSNPVTSLRTE